MPWIERKEATVFNLIKTGSDNCKQKIERNPKTKSIKTAMEGCTEETKITEEAQVATRALKYYLR
jgi:hypothetical protein